jgi:hypothetical protein
MEIERPSADGSLMDVLDRVLDKGVVVDAWVRVSLVGIDLLTVEARIVVASIETYLYHSPGLARVDNEPQRRVLSLVESLALTNGAGTPLPVAADSPKTPASPSKSRPRIRPPR